MHRMLTNNINTKLQPKSKKNLHFPDKTERGAAQVLPTWRYLVDDINFIKNFIKKEAIDPIRDSQGKTMRYAPEFLVSCTLLMMKSYKAYCFLRLNLLLPLPESQFHLTTT